MKRVIAVGIGAFVFTSAAAGVGWYYMGRWGSFGSGDGQFNEPKGAGVALNHTVYVADSSNHRVQYFYSRGSFIGKWGSYGTGEGQFEFPAGVGVA
jgi:tripartite motif-containing protein 71